MFLKNIGNHFFVIATAFFVGIFYADNILFLSGYSTLVLATIFFLSSLKINLTDIKKSLIDKKIIFVFCLSMLFLLPFLVYYLANIFFPDIAVALLILSAMPAGMTAPLLTEISKGKQSLALVFAVTSSLLAPVTVPFTISFLIGAVVDVSFWEMFILLSQVIYIPFVLAQIIKKNWQLQIDKISKIFSPLSTFLLGVLITIIVAKQSQIILGGFENLYYLSILFGFFLLIHLVSYLFSAGRNRGEKIAIIVSFSYMNFTLAIEIVNEFFTEPNIIIPVVLSIIPWAIIYIPFKYIVYKNMLK